MTPNEIRIGLGRLKSYYPNAKFDDLNTAAYSEVLSEMNYEDFCAGMKELVKVSEFFPSVAKINDAVNEAAKVRFQAREREEREERLAIKAADEAIMNPKSEVHRVVVGPNHQRFIDMLEGRIVLPEPEWLTKSKARQTKGGTV